MSLARKNWHFNFLLVEGRNTFQFSVHEVQKNVLAGNQRLLAGVVIRARGCSAEYNNYFGG
jgi:hypothetical protein